MLRSLRALLRTQSANKLDALGSDTVVPVVDPDELAFAIVAGERLPQLDWSLLEGWIAERAGGAGADGVDAGLLRRGVGRAWLAMLSERLEGPTRCWSGRVADGVASTASHVDQRAERVAERAARIVADCIAPLLGSSDIPPVIVVVAPSLNDYLDLTACRFQEEEGESATSGGTYIHGDYSPSMILCQGAATWAIENTIAHEMAHHVLYPYEIPLWVEEGLTQMMEERVVGGSNYQLTAELVQRHREHWDEESLERYWHAEAFGSPDGDEQELAYHLSETLVRRLLTQRPDEFFRFLKASRGSETGRQAAESVFGCTLEGLADGLIEA